jgi:hypothetical protein
MQPKSKENKMFGVVMMIVQLAINMSIHHFSHQKIHFCVLSFLQWIFSFVQKQPKKKKNHSFGHIHFVIVL